MGCTDLEVDCEVEDYGEEPGAEEECEEQGEEHVTVFEESGWQGGSVAQAELGVDEDEGEDAEAAEETDYAGG